MTGMPDASPSSPDWSAPSSGDGVGVAVDASSDGDRRRALELEKLELETAQLRHSLSHGEQRWERVQAYGAAAGIISTAVAVASLCWTLISTNQSRAEERYAQAVAELTDTSPQRRLAGTAALRNYLSTSAPDRQSAILQSLITSLAVEDNAVVRSAIVDVITSDQPTIKPSSYSAALQTAVVHSRAFVQSEDLDPFKSDSDDFVKGLGSQRMREVGALIPQLLRKGARTVDLSGIYCRECDFSGLDLSGTSFDRALLPGSDFTHATLRRAGFRLAWLRSVSFEGAVLADSIFSSSATNAVNQYHMSVAKYASTGSANRSNMFPDFTCADLRSADLRGLVTWAIVPDAMTEVKLGGSAFAFANLSNTRLSGSFITYITGGPFPAAPVSAWAFVTPRARVTPELSEQGWKKQYYAVVGAAHERATFVRADFFQSFFWLGFLFERSNWSEARFESPVLGELFRELIRNAQTFPTQYAADYCSHIRPIRAR
jgi:uncharacterized protein YjbI with pentapeptide repeats